MFQSSRDRVMAWVERTLAPSDDEPVGPDDHYEVVPTPPHPHRRQLRWERKRRPGSLPHPPAHCISPVRHGSGARTPHGTAR